MKLETISVPWTPHPDGPWRLRSTRSTGESCLGTVSYSRRADAEDDARWCNRMCREGCTYDVVPDREPQSARIFM